MPLDDQEFDTALNQESYPKMLRYVDKLERDEDGEKDGWNHKAEIEVKHGVVVYIEDDTDYVTAASEHDIDRETIKQLWSHFGFGTSLFPDHAEGAERVRRIDTSPYRGHVIVRGENVEEW